MQQKVLLTADDLLRLPDDGMRHELVRGELRTMPPAGGEHGIVAGEIFGLLRDWVRRGQLGTVFAAETGFKIERDPDVVRAPDASFVAAGRLGTGRPPSGFPELAPDLAVEVVSPYDTAAEVEEKAQQWMRSGVRLLWVVYPATRSVLTYSAPTAVRSLTQDDELDGGEVLPGFTCPVRNLFPY